MPSFSDGWIDGFQERQGIEDWKRTSGQLRQERKRRSWDSRYQQETKRKYVGG